MPRLPHFLSLGAGVQSSTLALMAAHGEIRPMPTAAIFADTQRESPNVYAWLDWLEQQLPFPIYQVTAGDLGRHNLRLRVSRKSGNRYVDSLIPVFVKKPSGKMGMMPRRCTTDYKIVPIQRQIKRLLGVRRVRRDSPVLCVQWIGISTDEAHRMKPAHVPYIRNRWPLIQANVSRADCYAWMRRHGYPVPPRSACTFCPYHSDAEWARLKRDEPAAFREAVRWERDYQAAIAQDTITEGTPYLHRSLIPLRDVTFDERASTRDSFGDECEGMCGV